MQIATRWQFFWLRIQTADLSSFNGAFQQKHTKKRMTHKLQTIGSFDGTKLARWDFWSTDSNFGQLTSNLGSFNGIFQQSVNFGQQTAYHSKQFNNCTWQNLGRSH